MKRLAHILAFVWLSLTSLQRFHTKPAFGPILAILLSPLKLLAGSLAALSACYIQCVTTTHHAFELAFG